jgi:DNA-binding CsgD family transcriptional regulator/PAS domain-containing protein
MLDLDLDLAELLLLAPAEEPVSPVPLTCKTALERFVEGLCRTVGALAGCIVVAGEGVGPQREPAQAIGLVGRNEAARSALRTLIDGERTLSRRGYSWIRDASTPYHCGLMVEMPSAGQSGHLLLAFAHDQLDDERVIAQVLTLAPGLGLMAGAVQEIAAECDAAERRQYALMAVLRQSDCGIIVVGADQSVLFANPAARAILDVGDGMELRRNMLRPTRYQDAIRFHAALDAVIAPPRHRDRRSERGAMLLLERPGPNRPLIAVIAPADHAAADGSLPARGENGRADQGRAAAIIRLMRPEISVTRGLEPICHLHGLSPVETQLVVCLARGLTLGQAATQMRIKPDTARTYLKQVFAKTDTHRQTDLLQLLLRYQRAVSGDVLFEAA